MSLSATPSAAFTFEEPSDPASVDPPAPVPGAEHAARTLTPAAPTAVASAVLRVRTAGEEPLEGPGMPVSLSSG
jgi:hypothetical protein